MAFQRRVLVCEAQQDWGSSLRGLRHNQVNTTKAAKQSFGSKQAIETSKVGRLQKAILGEGKIRPSDAVGFGQSHATSGHRSTSTGPTPIPPWRNSGRGLQGAEIRMRWEASFRSSVLVGHLSKALDTGTSTRHGPQTA